MPVSADMVCSFKVIRPETHKFKFPDLFPSHAFIDWSDSKGETDEEALGDTASQSTDTSFRQDSLSSVDSSSTIDDVVVPTDYDTLTATMPNLKLTYDDYIRIVENKNIKKFA
jgi:hypothetical protein